MDVLRVALLVLAPPAGPGTAALDGVPRARQDQAAGRAACPSFARVISFLDERPGFLGLGHGRDDPLVAEQRHGHVCEKHRQTVSRVATQTAGQL